MNLTVWGVGEQNGEEQRSFNANNINKHQFPFLSFDLQSKGKKKREKD